MVNDKGLLFQSPFSDHNCICKKISELQCSSCTVVLNFINWYIVSCWLNQWLLNPLLGVFLLNTLQVASNYLPLRGNCYRKHLGSLWKYIGPNSIVPLPSHLLHKNVLQQWAITGYGCVGLTLFPLKSVAKLLLPSMGAELTNGGCFWKSFPNPLKFTIMLIGICNCYSYFYVFCNSPCKHWPRLGTQCAEEVCIHSVRDSPCLEELTV